MAFSPIQHTKLGGNGNPTLTFPQSSTAGTLLVVCFLSDTGSLNTPTGWTKVPDVGTTSHPIEQSIIYYRNNPGSIASVALTHTGPYYGLVFGEFAGVATVSPLDTQGGGAQSANPFTVTASSTTAQAGELVIVAAGASGSANPQTITVNSSTPTLTELDAETDGADYSVCWAWYGTSGASGATATATLSDTAAQDTGVVATFLPTGAATEHVIMVI